MNATVLTPSIFCECLHRLARMAKFQFDSHYVSVINLACCREKAAWLRYDLYRLERASEKGRAVEA